ncbi:MAG: hypothetical protein CMH46_08725 [Muricauda sp.]|nr:hypothetical protein [Allomuricauda sp.]
MDLPPVFCGNAGHSIPHSPDQIEHPPNQYKNLTFIRWESNSGWLKFSVLGGPGHTAHPEVVERLFAKKPLFQVQGSS